MLSSGWVAWNSIVVGYAQIGKFVEALQFYGQFRRLPMLRVLRVDCHVCTVITFVLEKTREGKIACMQGRSLRL